MKAKVLDTVVLEIDITSHGLMKGDVGAVVEIYEPDGSEVVFVTGSGLTQAVVMLKNFDVRQVADTDILSVRSLNTA